MSCNLFVLLFVLLLTTFSFTDRGFGGKDKKPYGKPEPAVYATEDGGHETLKASAVLSLGVVIFPAIVPVPSPSALPSPSKQQRCTRCIFFFFLSPPPRSKSYHLICASRSTTAAKSPAKVANCDSSASANLPVSVPVPVASDRVANLNRSPMHLLSSPPLNDHNCGGFNNLIAWLLNGLIADTVATNPQANVECFIFAQRLPADTLAGIKKDAELVSRTASHYTGCMVRELPTSLSGPDSAQGLDHAFKERGLFWAPDHFPDGVVPTEFLQVTPI